MRNNTVSGQMTVTKPVMVSVSSPHFLREGDIYVLDASVSNSTDEDVTGTLELFVYETENYKDAVPVLVKSIPMDLDAGGRASGSFSVEVFFVEHALVAQSVECILGKDEVTSSILVKGSRNFNACGNMGVFSLSAPRSLSCRSPSRSPQSACWCSPMSL